MPFTQIYIHLIWATKNRMPFLSTKAIRSGLIHHIHQSCKKNDIHLLTVNCVTDHIHLLISLGREQTLAQTVKQIKGESSRWVNETKLLDTYFSWQREYMEISISHTHLDAVREYIANQERHHTTSSVDSEFEYFSNKYGFAKPGFE